MLLLFTAVMILGKSMHGLIELGQLDPAPLPFFSVPALGIFADAWSTLLNDLNVPGALGGIFSKIKEADQASTDAATAKTHWLSLWFMLEALGLTLPPPESEVTHDIPADIQALAQQRWDAKAAKDWATADALRKQLDAAGWLIKDSKEGFTVVKK